MTERTRTQLMRGRLAKPTAHRRFLPWHSVSRNLMRRAWDLVPIGSVPEGNDPISSTIAFLFAVVLFPFMIPALLVLPFFLVESLLQCLIAPFGWVLRLIGVLPVTVEVRKAGEVLSGEKVSGWAAAKARAEQVRAHLAGGSGAP